jgi:tRNA-specific 2-thiouridylase
MELKMSKTVIAAMSGGVDSSVAAALLKEQGYNVIGITLNVWPSERSGLTCSKSCCSITDVDDARRVCNKLNIPHYVLNMQEIFKEKVIDYFVSEYLKGKTPNPCIACNEHIKFDALMSKAKALGADYVATGHYAEVVRDCITGEPCLTDEPCLTGELCLKRSKDTKKDQTYVLYTLNQNQLSHLLLPCGSYTKQEIRQLAFDYELPTFQKADSQDICFIGEEGYKGFIKNYLNLHGNSYSKPGNVIDKSGKVLGQHDGVFNFTIGQRKGTHKYTNESSYVTAIDAESATVYLGKDEDLFSGTLTVHDMRYMLSNRIIKGAVLNVKIRYSAPEAEALITEVSGNMLTVVFETPQRAITAGQAAVFYKEDILLGGGTIC